MRWSVQTENVAHERFASVLWAVIVGSLMFVPAVAQGRWWLALAAIPIGGTVFFAHWYNRRKGVPPLDGGH